MGLLTDYLDDKRKRGDSSMEGGSMSAGGGMGEPDPMDSDPTQTKKRGLLTRGDDSDSSGGLLSGYLKRRSNKTRS